MPYQTKDGQPAAGAWQDDMGKGQVKKPLEEPLLADADSESPRCQDVGCVILFAINLVISVALGVYSSITCDWNELTQVPDDSDSGAIPTSSPTYDPDDVSEYTKQGVVMLIISIVFGVILAYASLKMAQKCTRCLLYTGGALQILVIIIFYIMSRYILFVFLGVLLVAFYVWLLWQRDSIEFAIWVVQTACRAIFSHQSIICLVLFFNVMTGIFVSGYFAITAGTYAKYTYAAVYLLFSTYWFSETFNNVVTVTISCLAADWAYGLGHIDSNHAVSGSFKFASTKALGSIAFGSLIVSFLKTLRVVARMMASSKSNNGVAAVIALCCMCFIGIIEDLMRYFNEWAYAYIGMYHKDFKTSASLVWNLFVTNGWEAIKNDIYTDLVTGVPPLMAGLVVGGIIAAVAGVVFDWVEEGIIIAGIVGGLVALILTSMVMRIIRTSQNVIFLSYLELRDRFYAKHPEIVGELEAKFALRYPDIQFGGPGLAQA